jgi:hypothetical protein
MTDGPVTPPPTGGMPGVPASLPERVKNILVTPKTEWPRIDSEPATIAGIYTGYVLILAAIGPIAMLIGQQVFGIGAFGYTWKPSIGYSVATAVLSYILSLVAVYVSSLVINALAPTFGGTQDQVKAFKVAAYASTAGWVAGIFGIIPLLGWLALIGALYGLYLLYIGLPILMRVTQDKAIGYIVVVIVVNIVLYFVIALLVATLMATFFSTMMPGPVVRY